MDFLLYVIGILFAFILIRFFKEVFLEYRYAIIASIVSLLAIGLFVALVNAVLGHTQIVKQILSNAFGTVVIFAISYLLCRLLKEFKLVKYRADYLATILTGIISAFFALIALL